MLFDLAVVGKGLIGSAAARHASLSSLPTLSTNNNLDNTPPSNSPPQICLIGPDEKPRDEWTQTDDIFSSHYDEGRITRRTDPDPIWSKLASASIDRYEEIFQQSGGIEFYKPVGHLAVATPSSSDVLQKRRNNAREQGVSFQNLDENDLVEQYPSLRFAPGSSAIFEDCGGHISPRSLVKAQVEAAKATGRCKIISHVVDRVDDINHDSSSSNDDGASFAVTLSNGETIHAKRVLVCTGAFCDARPLLPDGQGGHMELDLHPYTAQTIHFHLNEKDTTTLLNENMPSIIYRSDGTEWSYVLPPIPYPDGSWRVKLGGAKDRTNDGIEYSKIWSPGTNPLSTHRDIVAWFQTAGDSKDADDMKEMLQTMLPGVVPVKVSSDACATCKTSSGRPYIGQLRKGLFVAVGGCGLAAKSSDEIGRIAASAALSESGWGADEELDRELFTPRLRG